MINTKSCTLLYLPHFGTTAFKYRHNNSTFSRLSPLSIKHPPKYYINEHPPLRLRVLVVPQHSLYCPSKIVPTNNSLCLSRLLNKSSRIPIFTLLNSPPLPYSNLSKYQPHQYKFYDSIEPSSYLTSHQHYTPSFSPLHSFQTTFVHYLSHHLVHHEKPSTSD